MANQHLTEAQIEQYACQAAQSSPQIEPAERFHLKKCPVCLRKYEFFFEFYQTLLGESSKPMHPSIALLATGHYPPHLHVLSHFQQKGRRTDQAFSLRVLPPGAQSKAPMTDRYLTHAVYASTDSRILIRVSSDKLHQKTSFHLLTEGGTERERVALLGLVEKETVGPLVPTDAEGIAIIPSPPGEMNWARARMLVYLPIAHLVPPPIPPEEGIVCGQIHWKPLWQEDSLTLSILSAPEPIGHVLALREEGSPTLAKVENGMARLPIPPWEGLREILLFN